MLIFAGQGGELGLLVLFAVTAVISVARTGDAPDTFVLFLFGFLLILVGQLLFARDLRPTLGRGWLLPIAAVVGLVVALGAGDNPVHDVGLFVFEAAWVTLGVALLRAERRRPPHTAPALVWRREYPLGPERRQQGWAGWRPSPPGRPWAREAPRLMEIFRNAKVHEALPHVTAASGMIEVPPRARGRPARRRR